uniref:DNA-directed RNA polymerase II subunit n=1 Tax=Lotharella vacuolata TaxID=74820 RepID=A0A0H5BKW3_9EUKA|nr:DNA-directed RNA polymerase II subunit [Lotharella vacuolata]
MNIQQMEKHINMKILNPIMTDLNFISIIKNINYFFLNTIRNFLMTKIHNYAINSLIIFLNTSILNDEVLAHRIGLIPIVNNCLFEKSYYKEKIGKIFFEINHTCFKEKVYLLNSNSININDEFPLFHPYGKGISKKNPDFVDKWGYLIAKLKKKQSINAKIYIEENSGMQHTKWNFCSGVLFIKIPTLKWNFLILKAINFLEETNFNKIIIKSKAKIHSNFSHLLFVKINSIESDKGLINFITILRDLKILEFTNSKKFLLKFETNGTLITKYAMLNAIEKILKNIDLMLTKFKWKQYKKRDSNP